LPTQVGEQSRGSRNGRFGVERIGKAALPRRAGHELRYSLSAGMRDHVGPKAALAPDEPREEADWQSLVLRRGLDQPADGFIDRFTGARLLRVGRSAGCEASRENEANRPIA
jgi:hypothetical protein